MRFAWEGRTPRDYSTTYALMYPRKSWDNFVSMTVLVIDGNDRVVEKIPLDIDEKEGWPLVVALNRYNTVVETWRKLNVGSGGDKARSDA